MHARETLALPDLCTPLPGQVPAGQLALASLALRSMESRTRASTPFQ